MHNHCRRWRDQLPRRSENKNSIPNNYQKYFKQRCVNIKFIIHDRWSKNNLPKHSNVLYRIHDNLNQSHYTRNSLLIKRPNTSKERLCLNLNQKRGVWTTTGRSTCKWITRKTTWKLILFPNKTHPRNIAPQNPLSKIFPSCWLF